MDDDLWALIEPLLPPWPEKSPGPRPVADRLCLQGILYVLHNDIAWQLLPLELGFGSGQTCWRRLERLDRARTLTSIEDDDVAMGILAELQARLVSVPAPQGLRSLGDLATEMLEQVPQAITALADPADRQLLRGWASVTAELVDESGDRMLHWDLHYDNVLAAQRGPWLAIDPEPLAGDPGFDLWPALDSRWDDVVAKGDTLRVVRRRFDLLTEVLGLDRARATGWTLGRLLQNSLWDIDDGETALAPSSVAIAESLLNR